MPTPKRKTAKRVIWIILRTLKSYQILPFCAMIILMRSCLLFFLGLIFLIFASTLIWSYNLIKVSQAKEILAVLKEAKTFARVLENHREIVGLLTQGKTTKETQGLVSLLDRVAPRISPEYLENETTKIVLGSGDYLAGKIETPPNLDLKPLKEILITDPQIPRGSAAELLKDIPDEYQLSKDLLRPSRFWYQKINPALWISGGITLVVLILILLVAQGMKGKTSALGSNLLVLGGELALVAWILKTFLSPQNLGLDRSLGNFPPNLGKLLIDIAQAFWVKFNGLAIKEGLILLGTGLVLYVLARFLPKPQPQSTTPSKVK